jgi:hypothetical protein
MRSLNWRLAVPMTAVFAPAPRSPSIRRATSDESKCGGQTVCERQADTNKTPCRAVCTEPAGNLEFTASGLADVEFAQEIMAELAGLSEEGRVYWTMLFRGGRLQVGS